MARDGSGGARLARPPDPTGGGVPAASLTASRGPAPTPVKASSRRGRVARRQVAASEAGVGPGQPARAAATSRRIWATRCLDASRSARSPPQALDEGDPGRLAVEVAVEVEQVGLEQRARRAVGVEGGAAARPRWPPGGRDPSGRSYQPA